MADYLKGTVTEAYLRVMNQDAAIVVTNNLNVRSIFYGDFGESGDPQLHIFDMDGNIDTTVENEIVSDLSGSTWAALTAAQKATYVFVNCGDPTGNNPDGTASGSGSVTIEPWEELSELGPDLSIGWEEFDAIGTPVTQYIPIRKEFMISFTQKAVDGKWNAVLFGDSSGSFAHHGIHTVGGLPTLTCFEGKNEIGTDIGYQINLVLGRQTGGRWVVMRAKNLCLHACGVDISPAAITSRTIEFSGNHGYLYTVANTTNASGKNVPNTAQFHWSLADGS